jgi:hypothetical protein
VGVRGTEPRLLTCAQLLSHRAQQIPVDKRHTFLPSSSTPMAAQLPGRWCCFHPLKAGHTRRSTCGASELLAPPRPAAADTGLSCCCCSCWRAVGCALWRACFRRRTSDISTCTVTATIATCDTAATVTGNVWLHSSTAAAAASCPTVLLLHRHT